MITRYSLGMFFMLLAQFSVTAQSKKGFVIEAQVEGACTYDTLRLYGWQGYMVQELQKTTAITEKGLKFFRFTLAQRPAQGMYYLGKDLSELRHIVMDNKDKKISFVGTCEHPAAWVSTNSPVNQAYDVVIPKLKANGDDFFTQIQEFQAHAQNTEKVAVIKKEMEAIDKRKKHLYDSIVGIQPVVGKIVAINTYYSYLNNNKDAAKTEGVYFAESFFSLTNFTDSTYSRLPYYFEAIQSYASNLTRVGLNAQQQEQYADALLKKIPAETHPNYQPTLLALAFGIMTGNEQLFVKYAKMYTAKYKGQNEQLDKFITERVGKITGEGGPLAPNIREMTPDSTYLQLSDMKGKYVLIDFWASWCGPCRQENPNVVKLYNKYKDKGFDILGVSLDKSHQAWVDAIKKDNLTWKHVSDLKGWSSTPAQAYGVTGIPYTVLVDKEGRIIATRLRGEQLAAKLAQLFGE